MLFAIKNLKTGEIEEASVSHSEEAAWDRSLGFTACDDQWAWQKQQAETNGYYCVEVELVQKPNKKIDDSIIRKTLLYLDINK